MGVGQIETARMGRVPQFSIRFGKTVHRRSAVRGSQGRHAPTGATRTLEPLSRRSTSRCTVGGVTFSRGLYFLFFTLSRITCAGTADRPCPVSLSPVLSSPPTPQFATERVCNKHLTSHLLLLQLLLLLCCYCRCSCCCAAAGAAPATQSHTFTCLDGDEP